jgi:O-antigen/teichoic acid export membrane protein
MINSVVAPMLIIPLLLMGVRSIGIVTVTVLLSLLVDGLYIWYTFDCLKCKFDFRGLDKNIFKEIFLFSVFIAINMIVDQINTNVDKILIARFKGTDEVAVYAVAATLQSYYTQFSTSVSGVFTPRIHHIINETKNNVENQKRRLTELFVKVGRIQFAILALILSGIILFGKSFILNFWAGKGFENSYYVALLLIVPSTIPLIENLGIEIQRALNLHQFRSIIYLVMAILNLILSIFLCQKYGAIGSAIGTTIAVFLANGLIMNIFYHKHCNIDIIVFWKNITSMIPGMILPIAIGVGLIHVLDISRFFQFLLAIFAYSIGYCIGLWCCSLNDYEKQLVLNPLNNLARRLYTCLKVKLKKS